ncbi:hypothetical protein CCP3SC15_710011 [Gammaproteobacteria bacterium]
MRRAAILLATLPFSVTWRQLVWETPFILASFAWPLLLEEKGVKGIGRKKDRSQLEEALKQM